MPEISSKRIVEAHKLKSNAVVSHKAANIDDKQPEIANAYLLFSKESIIADIGNQNFASKRCAIAQISSGKISFKYHPFHR